jgi:hypothetical protein
MSFDPQEMKDAARAEYHARWEAVEAFKAQELAAMTEDRARQIIQMLGAVEGWREPFSKRRAKHDSLAGRAHCGGRGSTLLPATSGSESGC